jgi:hypothetical protein
VFRADHDLVRKKPDAVFIEFSLNDGRDVSQRPVEVAGALEGIVRKLRLSKPDTDICFAYTLPSSGVGLLNQGRFNASVSLQETIAAHYQIPTIHMGMEVSKMAAENKLVFTAPKNSAALASVSTPGSRIFSAAAFRALPSPFGSVALTSASRAWKARTRVW